MTMQRVMKMVIFLVCTFGVGIAAQLLWTKYTAVPDSYHGTVLSKPRLLPAFSLEATDGRLIDIQSLQGHWTFLFFGFTHCASVCPVTMAELAKMVRLMSLQPDLPSPVVMMVTLDPQRDTLTRMKDYVHSFHPKFMGASGAAKELQNLARYLGIAYTQVKSSAQTPANDYSIEHTGAIMLLNPRGELVAFFTPPHEASLLVHDYQQLVASSK